MYRVLLYFYELIVQIRSVMYDDDLYQQSKDYFLALGRSDFLQKSQLSLCGRYCISRKMAELWYSSFIPEDGVYHCWIYTYSISHSHDQLLFAVDVQPLAVDIEKIIERDTSLLKNISLLKASFSVWENFYFQWCAKECLVKYLNLSATETVNMYIQEFWLLQSYQKDFVISEFWFTYFLVLKYWDQRFSIFLLKKWDYVFALLR